MNSTDTHLNALEGQLGDLRRKLLEHPVYHSLGTRESLRVFMEHHVFAVWDFMSILKTLQRRLTCVELPWVPSGDRDARRLVNEIVLGEESDEDGRGGYVSHYELYREAMHQCEADTSTIDVFLTRISHGLPVREALVAIGAPQPVRAFVGTTFDIIDSDNTCAIAAAFTFGREELIPDLFQQIVRELNRQSAGQLDRFVYYLERHIELDADQHGPMALKMLASLCGDDDSKWQAATEAALRALGARRAFWDGVLEAVTRT
jgi:hypothetical protein